MGLSTSFAIDRADDTQSSVTRERPLTTQAAYELLHRLEQDGASGGEILSCAIRDVLRGRIAMVSAFGAESALLLALVAEVDPSVPVVFLETGKHFAETLAYRDALAAHLGLTDVRNVTPGARALEQQDPTGELWYYDQDACCNLRKVVPLEQALSPFAAWISGRKRFQTTDRTSLPIVEWAGEKLKINPLADWDIRRIAAELARRSLPQHPLVKRGYLSIGCATCTRAVGAGEDSRAGRWAGSSKVECGIHNPSQVLSTAA